METVGVCKGCTHVILGHLYAHVTNMNTKYLDLNLITSCRNMQKLYEGQATLEKYIKKGGNES